MATYASNLTHIKAQAQSRALDQAKRRLARQLSPPVPGLQNRQPTLTRRWATISAVNSDGTVSISLDGTAVQSVSCLASYAPSIGDPVILDILGSDPVVIGTTATPTRAGQGIPTGALLDYAGGTVPLGYLLCNGAAVSRTTYADLFAVIGTTWGAGDGSTTFNLPDLRGRVTIGSGQGSGLTNRTLAGSGGEENHALTLAENGTHNHADSGHGHGSTGGISANHTHTTPHNMRDYDFGAIIKSRGDFAVGDTTTTLTAENTTTGNESANHTHSVGTGNAAIGNSGSGTAHNTMQPYRVVTKIIKT